MAGKKFINLDNLIYFWDGGGSAGAKKYIDDKDSEIKAETSAVSSSLSSHSNTSASTSTMGHVKIGANISVNSGTISLSQSNVIDALGYTPPTDDTATTSNDGLMSSSMVTKLDNIESYANNYILPKATSSSLGGVKIGSNVYLDEQDTLFVPIVTRTDPGVVPPVGDIAYVNTISSQSTEWVLTTKSGSTPAWRKLPSNAFKNDDTTYSTATTSYNGLMSSSMVTKLNNIDSYANYYVLPKASSSTLGGVKIGSNIFLDEQDALFVPIVNQTDHGVVPPTGYSANGTISSQSTEWVLSVAPAGVDGGIAWRKLPSNAFNNTTYSTATTSNNGLMSSSMVTKLNNIDSYANNYSLPNATSSTKGGVKIGSNISVSSGTISLSKSNVETALGYTIVIGSSVPSSAPSNQITFVV